MKIAIYDEETSNTYELKDSDIIDVSTSQNLYYSKSPVDLIPIFSSEVVKSVKIYYTDYRAHTNHLIGQLSLIYI